MIKLNNSKTDDEVDWKCSLKFIQPEIKSEKRKLQTSFSSNWDKFIGWFGVQITDENA